MIVIYTQDKTILRKDAKAAHKDLLNLYGHKLGTEAFKAIENNRRGTSYRKNGGPLVQVVDDSQVERIRRKEADINMLSEED